MRFPLARAAPVAIAVLAIAVHVGALGHDLVHDDVPQVIDNAWIRDLSNIPDMFRTHVAGFADDQVANYYRPLMHVVYAVTYSAFGPTPWAFHLVSILLHAVCAVLVWRIARDRLARVGDGTGAAAALAGVVFAVHPIHVEAVAWVAGVPDLTYTGLVLAALWAFDRFEAGTGSRRVALATALVLFLLAPFAKEPALALPLVLVVLEAARGGSLRSLRRWLPLVPFFVLSAFYLAVRQRALGDLAPLPRHPELSTWECVLQAPVLFAGYLAKLVVPVGLNAFHVLHPVHSPLEPDAALGIAVAVAFVAAAAVAFRRDRTTLLALLLVAVPLLPVLWVPWVGENTFAERYLYLPSAGFALLVGRVVAAVRAARPRAFRAVAAVALGWTVALAAATVQRVPVWANERALWTDTVARSPDGALPRTMLGDVLLSDGDLAGAIAQYEAALAVAPGDTAARTNLGLALLRDGRVPEAIARLVEADRIEPGSPQTLNNLGLAYRAAGRLDESAAAFEAALARSPGHPGVLRNLARTYALQGRADAAARAEAEADRAERTRR